MKYFSAHQPTKQFFQLLASEPRKPITLLSVFMILSSISAGLGVMLLVPLINLLGGGEAPKTGLMMHFAKAVQIVGLPYNAVSFLTIFVGLQLIKIIFEYKQSLFSMLVQQGLINRLRHRCFDAVMKSEWVWLSQRNNAQYANLLLTDVSRIGTLLSIFISICSSVAMLAAYFFSAMVLSWKMASLVLMIGLFFAISERKLRGLSLQMGERMSQSSLQFHSAVQDSLAGIKLAKILGNEGRHLRRFEDSMREVRDQMLNFQRNIGLSNARMQLGGLIVLVVLLYLGLQVFHLPLAELGTLIFVFARLMPMAAQLQGQFLQWNHNLPALENANKVLAECAKVAEADAPNQNISMQSCLELRAVDFTYPSRQQQTLHAINLRIPSNSTTAIIGASGAGKSTLADLLMGLLQPNSGGMFIDGKLLDNTTRIQWRRSVSYVPQETVLFNDTIKSNLLWAAPAASDEQLWQALDKAAAGFVRQLPQGIDTRVGDQGLCLSGGERQRIALARALLGKPSLLILDEATSALDMENEERIRQAIVNLYGDLTVVVIGHRMATLQHADQVLIMEAGSIIANGTWDDLKNSRAMHSAQANAQIDSLRNLQTEHSL